MSCCNPTQSCSSAVPETCEALPTVEVGARVLVENEANCKRAIQSPTNPSILQQTSDGEVQWKDGSALLPIQLPNLQNSTEAEALVAKKSTGDATSIKGTVGAAEPEVLINEGASWAAIERSKQFGAGIGILIRGLSGLAVWLNGSVGQILKIGTSGFPEWGDTSTWITKTSNYTAVNGDQILADTTSGAFNITLPLGPSDMDEIIVNDKAGTWGTSNLTINRNGENIDGAAENLVCNAAGKTIHLIFNATISSWEIYT